MVSVGRKFFQLQYAVDTLYPFIDACVYWPVAFRDGKGSADNPTGFFALKVK